MNLHEDLEFLRINPQNKTWLMANFSKGSLSFSFSALFSNKDDTHILSMVYAFCRTTDDLVDNAPQEMSADILRKRLEYWRDLCLDAYRTQQSPFPLLNDLFGYSAKMGVPFSYAAELISGMQMDIAHRTPQTWGELRLYSYRVASVIGMWITELAGVHNPKILLHAAQMGHAMQLTNILRDVGEDLSRGRIYIPKSVLERYKITERHLYAALKPHAPLPSGWPELTEKLIHHAIRDYERAFHGLHALPPSLRRATTVASHVYRAILTKLRKNNYDNLQRRAVTSKKEKLTAALRGLWTYTRHKSKK